MPLIHNETDNGCQLAVWHMEESEEALSSMLASGITCNFSSPHRRREFLTIRVMARQLGIAPDSILYHESGAPYIEGGATISISHTKEYAAILLSHSNRWIGVDVEMASDRFERVESHYLHSTESQMLREELPEGMRIEEALGIWWTAKEALYKAAGEQHIRFTEDFRIYGLKDSLTYNGCRALDNGQKPKFKGRLSTTHNGTAYQFTYRVMEDFTLTCCFAE